MSKTLIPAQRQEKIQEYLIEHSVASSTELSELLEVSEATIRRDLDRMAEEGVLVRTHGGAILNRHLQLEQEYKKRAQRNVAEKSEIGRLASKLIQDGDIVFINSGTTTTQLIRQIEPNANITVVTNNLSAALDIADAGPELILLGGTFQPKSNSVAGRFSINNLNQIYANQSFIGVDGISLTHGYTVPSSAEAEIVKSMIERTKGPVTVIADHSKWEAVSNFEIAKFDRIQRLITDETLGRIAKDILNEHNIELLVAGISST